MIRRAAALALLASLCAAGADRWTVQSLPAPKGSSWQLADLKFASSSRGVAVGCLSRGARCLASSAVTSDGGRTWTVHPLPEAGTSLFFLNEAAGWMTGARALFKTGDGGLTWERLPDSDATANAYRVHFISENTGWAVGARKSAFATTDGGRNWSRITAAETVNTSVENTVYQAIAFADGRSGMIAGASLPPRPDAAAIARELPHLGVFVSTRDGGTTWRASVTSMFGRVTRMAFAPDGRGLGLIEFAGEFDFPAEVFRIEWKTGRSERAFRDPRGAVTDVLFDADGNALLAAVGATRIGDRGRVRVLRSRDLSEWEEMPVADRPSARRVWLALAGPALWAATETGTLLCLGPR